MRAFSPTIDHEHSGGPLLYFEGFTCAKDATAPHTNEDQIVIVPGTVYAVVDGATDISGKRHDDRLGENATGGRLAARAVAEALYALASAPLPPLETILSRLNGAVADLHRRLGTAPESAGGFRAAMAACFITGDTALLVTVGDCAIRLNGGDLFRHDFPADRVLAAARARAWGLLADRGIEPETARPAVRAMIVAGLDVAAPAPLDETDLEEIRRALATDPEAERILSGGLTAVRENPSAFDAQVFDGVGDVAAVALVREIPLSEIKTLEIVSDGYPTPGAAASVAAWEAALAHVDAADPERVGDFPGTKGRAGPLFGDDRSIVILKTRPE